MTEQFKWGERTYVMGIINITTDSFSGDGILRQEDFIEAAVRQALSFQELGADILDIGGESTRPGSQMISQEEELERVVPVIAAIRRATSLSISVDTYKSAVADGALQAGADWINDVWALQADAHMAAVVAAHGCPVVLMHNRSKAGEVILHDRMGGMYKPAEYTHLVADVVSDLQASLAMGFAAGIRPEQVILDPGIGFGKTVEQNLELINRLDEIRALGYPVLLGPSRKSFIGQVLQTTPDDRLEGTMAAISIGIARGADIIRVHDVKAAVRTARMADALVR